VLVADLDIQRVKKDLEVHANSRRLLGWNVLCRCSTVAKVRLREYGYLQCFMRKPMSYVPLPLLPVHKGVILLQNIPTQYIFMVHETFFQVK